MLWLLEHTLFLLSLKECDFSPCKLSKMIPLALNTFLCLYIVSHIVLLGIRAPIADRYADQQRAEMLSKIVDLELEMKEKENTITSLCKEFEEKQLQYEEKIAGNVKTNF